MHNLGLPILGTVVVLSLLFLNLNGKGFQSESHASLYWPAASSQVSASFDNEVRPRVGVCFFGLTRSLRRYTYESITKYLLGRLEDQGLSVDVFLHTYAVDVLNNPWGGEYQVRLDMDEWQLLRPISYEVEDLATVDSTIDYGAFLQYGNPWEHFISTNVTFYNHLRQLRSLHRCWNLVEEHMNETGTDYQYVLMARPDVRYLAPGLPDLEAYCLSKACYNANAGDSRSAPRPRIAIAYEDRFAAGSPEAIKPWATRYDLALYFVQHYQRSLFSETFSRWAVLYHNLEYVLIPFCFERVRATGEVQYVKDRYEHCYRGLHPDNKPPPVNRTKPGSYEVNLVFEEEIAPPPAPPRPNFLRERVSLRRQPKLRLRKMN